MKNKILLSLFFLLSMGSSHLSSALECWKENGFWRHPLIGQFIFLLEEQSCYETPLGYVWVKEENIEPANHNSNSEHRLAVRLSSFTYNPGLHIRFLGIYSSTDKPIFSKGSNAYPKTGLKTPPGSVPANWTNWLDRDSQEGSGDWELLNLFPASQVCDLPVAIQAKTPSISYATFTPENAPPHILSTFRADTGLACVNAEQSQNGCYDYKVRFSCPEGTWTGWLNRDSQWGSGDYETKSGFSSVCAEPLLIRARLAGTNQVFAPRDETPDTLSYFSASQGLACVNDNQTDGFCENYEVRFLCP